ncbi:hypothetical protein BC628DRAFT_814218 [Trametes gibbosa]|nr:hypothetical protein BC628DRAFT_814218 [Trametes gibbosa]
MLSNGNVIWSFSHPFCLHRIRVMARLSMPEVMGTGRGALTIGMEDSEKQALVCTPVLDLRLLKNLRPGRTGCPSARSVPLGRLEGQSPLQARPYPRNSATKGSRARPCRLCRTASFCSPGAPLFWQDRSQPAPPLSLPTGAGPARRQPESPHTRSSLARSRARRLGVFPIAGPLHDEFDMGECTGTGPKSPYIMQISPCRWVGCPARYPVSSVVASGCGRLSPERNSQPTTRNRLNGRRSPRRYIRRSSRRRGALLPHRLSVVL